MQHFAKPDAVAVLCATTSGNIGDHIQTVGLESAIHKAFGDSCRVVRLRRDAVSSFREDVPVVVSGWYSHWHAMDFVPAVHQFRFCRLDLGGSASLYTDRGICEPGDFVRTLASHLRDRRGDRSDPLQPIPKKANPKIH